MPLPSPLRFSRQNWYVHSHHTEEKGRGQGGKEKAGGEAIHFCALPIRIPSSIPAGGIDANKSTAALLKRLSVLEHHGLHNLLALVVGLATCSRNDVGMIAPGGNGVAQRVGERSVDLAVACTVAARLAVARLRRTCNSSAKEE